jgi:hypothetical protein
VDERFDFGDKFFDALEGSATDDLLRDDVEPTEDAYEKTAAQDLY